MDLEEQTITFTHQLDGNGQRQPLKTKRSRRVIEVTPQLVSALRKAKLATTTYSYPHDLVFTSRTGRGHDHRNIGGQVRSRAVKRAGLGAVERDGVVVLPAPTFHALRHSHASALIAAGWDIADADRLERDGRPDTRRVESSRRP